MEYNYIKLKITENLVIHRLEQEYYKYFDHTCVGRVCMLCEILKPHLYN